MLKRRHAAPVAAGLLAALLLVAGGAAARSYGAPRNLAAPKVVGKAETGSRLSATRGRWSGSPTKFRYAWQRCNKGRKCVRVKLGILSLRGPKSLKRCAHSVPVPKFHGL